MSQREFTLEELAAHSSEKDCFIAVNGVVLDVSDYLASHPGGKKVPSLPSIAKPFSLFLF